jgi:CubicO group peptidase (beta-lactamase class C family)
MERAEFDAVMTQLAPPGGPGAAVAVRQGAQIVHAAGYGLADIEWGQPIDTDTVFRIGSITKQFTAAAILRLAEAGKLEVDDPIERHLPDYPVGERRITVRHLLNHTSGIKSITGVPGFATDLSRKDTSLAGMIDVFKELPPDFQPGERYLYNNSGYVLLGAIIEALAGMDYAAFLQREFFEPLGMTRTSYLSDTPIVTKRARGYVPGRDGIVNAPPISMTWPHAAGALGSTVGDLLTWNAALHGGKLLAPESYAAMTTPGALNDGKPMSYAFGLVRQTYREHPTIGHGGGINGFLTNLAHWPDDDLTIVVLANCGAFPIQRAAFGLARRALGLPDLRREAIEASDDELAACAGVYRFDAFPLQFRVKDGALTADFPRPRSVYRPMAPGAFFLADDPEATLEFEDRENGAYQRVAIQAYGGDPVRGVRVRDAA